MLQQGTHFFALSHRVEAYNMKEHAQDMFSSSDEKTTVDEKRRQFLFRRWQDREQYTNVQLWPKKPLIDDIGPDTHCLTISLNSENV